MKNCRIYHELFAYGPILAKRYRDTIITVGVDIK